MRLALIALFFGAASSVFAYTSPGSPTGFVNDFANVIPDEEQAVLEAKLTAVAASTTNEITVVTVPNLGGDYIENYAVELFEEWGIGTSENNNGVLLLIAVEDRELRIEVGYGLEGVLPDSVADRIIRTEMVPSLQSGLYGEAATRGVDAITAAIAGEYSAETSESLDGWAPFLIGGFVLVQWLFAIMARTKSWWLGGIVGAGAGVVASSVLSMWVLIGLFLTAFLFVTGLALDYAISRAYRESVRAGSNPPWWSGGSGSGWNSGGGFGGFGGGRSGGGGASGRW